MSMMNDARREIVVRLGATPCDICSGFNRVWSYARQKGTPYDFWVGLWLKAIDASSHVRTAPCVQICADCLVTFHNSEQYGRI